MIGPLEAYSLTAGSAPGEIGMAEWWGISCFAGCPESEALRDSGTDFGLRKVPRHTSASGKKTLKFCCIYR